MTTPGSISQNVVKRFGDHAAVDGASLTVENGEIVALLGPSGCGKTTTLRLIAGFEQPRCRHASRSAAQTSRGCRPIRRDIGLVFQDYALFPHMTVAANIDYGMRSAACRAPSSDAAAPSCCALSGSKDSTIGARWR